MGQDCVWDNEEQNRENIFHSIPYFAPWCPRGSLVPYKNEEQISCAVLFKSEENQFQPALPSLETGALMQETTTPQLLILFHCTYIKTPKFYLKKWCHIQDTERKELDQFPIQLSCGV